MEKGEIFDKRQVILVGILILLIIAYFTFDYYFRLPTRPNPYQDKQIGGNVADEKGNDEDKAVFHDFNILILGLDGRDGLNDRTDTIILASLDGDKKLGRLLSIPRDTRVKIKGSWDKVNAAYVYGGVELAQKTIEDFLDVRIDRYVIINFDGLIKMVDAVGGIEVDVPVRMYKPLEGINLKPGLQHLDGEQVLAYARFRGTPGGDIDRAARQQEVLQLLAEKVLKTANPTRLAELIEIAGKEIKTDLSFKEMVALFRLAGPVMENGLVTEVLPGSNKLIDEIWYWEPDLSQLSAVLSFPREEINIASHNIGIMEE
ncbi:MAG TPA: LCP family protein [Peptococcaceae bacterium]|jgi:LCP family protein required for cell wall assembly|nr:LCP family protein [Clostridia bacterium]HOB81740.1 LCP family protein [Peptococcaceae bacterium]HPZ71553.1 LCP family protein [Peptococcaceae bacterium]HQD54650.1 LCP family protein [Peptococcaceae bacterium]